VALLAGAQLVTSSKSLEELVEEGDKVEDEMKQTANSLFGLSSDEDHGAKTVPQVPTSDSSAKTA